MMDAYDPHQQHSVADYGRRYQEYTSYYASQHQQQMAISSSTSAPSSSASSNRTFTSSNSQLIPEPTAYAASTMSNGSVNGNGASSSSVVHSAPSSAYSGSAHPSPDCGAFADEFSYTAYAAQAQAQGSSGSRPPSASSLHQQQQQPGSSHSSPASSSQALRAQQQASSSTSIAHAQSSSAAGSALVAGTPLSRPLTHKEQELLAHLDRLKFFLATAPSRWTDSEVPDAYAGLGGYGSGRGAGGMAQTGTPMMPHPNMHPALNRFLLPSGEYVTCVLWSGLYHITGTDIVRALVFRFAAFGRPVRNMKKFEEGVFSDLRNLKPGHDACLEEPKSPFLDLLFKYQCIRTQKKQKVFYWFSVPHDRLFLDALERDLKREKMGLEPTTAVEGEPALSFTYDPKRSLYEQFSKAQGAQEGESELETNARRAEELAQQDAPSGSGGEYATASGSSRKASGEAGPGTPFFNMFSLFEGSPHYKQRRKKGPKTRGSGLRDSPEEEGPGNGPELVDEYEAEQMSAAQLFDAQVHSASPAAAAEHARRQAESQRRVQAHHLALLQQRTGAPMTSQRSNSLPHGQQQPPDYPSRSMHPSIVSQQTYPPMQQTQMHSVPHSNSLPTTMDYNSGLNVPSVPPMMPAVQQSLAGPQRTTSYDANGSGQKLKAYRCPLLSCQRVFKRMEHMKRHYRTHTMEKPFECTTCQRRFSRADNLAQHMRTHARDAGFAASGVVSGVPDANDMLLEEAEQVMYAADGSFDFNSCEIEVNNTMEFEDDVASNVGMVAANGYYGIEAGPQFSRVVMSPENSPSLNASSQLHSEWPSNSMPNTAQSVGYDYAQSSQTSPAFSAPSPQMQNPAAYRIQNEYAAGSMSAPSHKQTFDHSSLFPPALGLQGVSAAGPGGMRRYRSVTPTIARGGENIRRPSTANTLDASPLGMVPRGYHHPYSQYPGSTSASAQSSPAQFQAQLDYAQQAAALEEQQQAMVQQQEPHPHSRSNSAQGMQQMIASDVVGMGYTASSLAASNGAHPSTYADIYGQANAATTGHYVATDASAAGVAGYYSDAVSAASMAGMGTLNGSSAQYADHQYYDVNTN